MRRTITLLAALALTFTALPAHALNNSWISNPQISAVSIATTNVTALSNGFSLSTQSTGFDFVYTAPAGNGGKFAQINIFDVAGSLVMGLAANTSGTSSIGCDPQVLSSDTHTCFFKLDGLGQARIHVNLANVTSQGGFKYKILAGPNIQESAIAQVLFVPPTNKIAALKPSVKALAGGAGVLQFRVTQGVKTSAGIRVTATFKGLGSFLSSATASSDSKGLVTFYLSNFTKSRGSSVISVRVEGGASTAKSTILWVSGSLGK